MADTTLPASRRKAAARRVGLNRWQERSTGGAGKGAMLFNGFTHANLGMHAYAWE